jgi:hypothetical protein
MMTLFLIAPYCYLHVVAVPGLPRDPCLDDSEGLLEKARRRARRRRRGSATIGLAVIAVGFGLYAWIGRTSTPGRAGSGQGPAALPVTCEIRRPLGVPIKGRTDARANTGRGGARIVTLTLISVPERGGPVRITCQTGSS